MSDRIEEIRARLDNVYLERWQPFDSVPDEKWREAYDDIEYLLGEVERLRGGTAPATTCMCCGRLWSEGGKCIVCDIY